MTDKAAARERRLRRMEEEYGSELATTFTHSTFYHRFFEGYTETMVPRKGRRGNRIIRVYTGNYYTRACDDRAWHKIKLEYMALCLAAAAAYLYSVSREIPSNSVWYVALPGSLAVLCLLLLTADVLSCLGKARDMTLYDYKSSFRRLIWLCPVTSAWIAVTSVLTFVFLTGNQRPWSEWSAGVLCMAAAAAVLWIGRMEKRAEYHTKPGCQAADANGVMIE